MSPRAHFWLRLGSFCVIVLAQVLPRIAKHDAAPQAPNSSSAAQVEIARR